MNQFTSQDETSALTAEATDVADTTDARSSTGSTTASSSSGRVRKVRKVDSQVTRVAVRAQAKRRVTVHVAPAIEF